MLNNVNTLKGYTLAGLDGEIGSVKEFYFDDKYWGIRYLVADTGNWLVGKKVLISPYVLGETKGVQRQLAIRLTKKQIEESPSLESDKPVSRQYEKDFYGYYDLPIYWGGPYIWGAYPYFERDYRKSEPEHVESESWDPNLRSTQEIMGYEIHATDGELGHVDDFLIDVDAWAIRYLIVDMGHWWPGKKILISPEWIESFDVTDKKVIVSLSEAAIKESPAYTDDTVVDRAYEELLHDYYKRKGYWHEEPKLISTTN